MFKNQINNNKLKIKKYDIFVCSAGFEDRGLYISRTISNIYNREVIIFCLEDSYDINKANMNKISNYFDDNSKKTVMIQYTNPNETFRSMFFSTQEIVQRLRKPRVLVDITAFTHEHLLMIYSILKSFNNIKQISFCYILAKKYASKELKYADKWLIKGCERSRSIVGYSGLINPFKKSHLVILVGFEKKRAEYILRNSDYDKITIIGGSKEGSANEELYDIGAFILDNLKKEYPQINVHNINLIDNVKCENDLIEFLENNTEYNIFIYPMSNKISTIAVAKVILDRQNIQARYVPVKEYNKDDYSKYSDNIVIFD